MLSKTPEDKLKRQSLFLNCYREVGTVRGSCEAMGIDESTVYRWRDDDSFQDKFQLAKRSFADKLENLALNRVEQQKPSDNPTLLIAMLNANRPDKYRPTAHTTDDVEDEAVKTLKDLKRNYQINQQLYEDGYQKALEEHGVDKKEVEPTVIDVTVKPSPKPRPFKSESQLKSEIEARKVQARIVPKPSIKVKRW